MIRQFMHKTLPIIVETCGEAGDRFDEFYFGGDVIVSCDADYPVGMWRGTWDHADMREIAAEHRVVPMAVLEKIRELVCIRGDSGDLYERVVHRVIGRIRTMRDLEDVARNYYPGAHTVFPDKK